MENKLEELDWIQLREDMNNVMKIESPSEKIKRKITENPFVPIGTLATTAALGYGLYCFYTEQRLKSQYMMRARVVAQGFTILAMMVGMTMSVSK